MCFAYFKMNKFERNPEKYIKEKCAFLFSRGYSLKTFSKNGEYCFSFYIKGQNDDYNSNHVYFFYEDKYVDCSFSNTNFLETNIKALDITYPIMFEYLTNMEKMDFFISVVKDNIDLIDIRPLTKLQIALNLSKEKKHIEAFQIYEKLYNQDPNATNTFNLFQCSIYCGKTELENELYEKLKCYHPNPKKEPMELSGCFVRCYYGLFLCDVGRNDEAVEIVDYLIEVISNYKITDPTYLYIRGIPSATLVYELIKKVFVKNEEAMNNYKNKLLAVLDEETIKYEIKENI